MSGPGSWSAGGGQFTPGQAGGGQFTPGQAAPMPTSTVELSLQCQNLTDMDVFSKSDPFCVVYLKEAGSGGPEKWLCLDKTETIDNTLDPTWQKKFVLEYKFEKRQLLKFDVYDSDSDSPRLEDHDFIGSCECSLGEIVSAQGKGLTRPLKVGAGKAAKNKEQSITITAEELLANKEVLTLSLSGKKLDKKDWFGKSDPFVTISKAGEYGQFMVIHRTEVVMSNLNPDWRAFTIPLTTLCNGDHDRVLKIQVDDWNSSGSHSHIGEFKSSVRGLQDAGRGAAIPLVNEKKRAKKGDKYKHSGLLILNSIVLELRPTFLDFIQGGTELSFTVAVDFTGSNGNPQDPRSLHYNDPTGAPNQYVTAIRAVGDIIQDYDSDKKFPALGFGARVPPDGRVSHEFFLNLTNNPYCEGIDGVLAAYYQALNGVQLYGPTNFSPVINHVAKFAQAYQNDPTNYFVLLIITDGIITDLDATKAAIIRASTLPLSIIIVGVGAEDFSAMDELDSDDELLALDGKTAQRDIVQFVEMQKFVLGHGATATWNKELLAREVLYEIPDQLIGYMRKKGYKPGQPRKPVHTQLAYTASTSHGASPAHAASPALGASSAYGAYPLHGASPAHSQYTSSSAHSHYGASPAHMSQEYQRQPPQAPTAPQASGAPPPYTATQAWLAHGTGQVLAGTIGQPWQAPPYPGPHLQRHPGPQGHSYGSSHFGPN